MPTPFPNLPPFLRGSTHTQLHSSALLRDNPWGDPGERELLVYLPPGYEHGADHYPCVMFLPGFAGTGEKYLNRGLMDPSLPSVCDHLIEEGCPPFIGVMPDCMSSVGGSQYVDSPAIGPYASYVTRELRSFVQVRYRATGAWGLVGHSSGGFGALHLAMEFPGVYQAVACHAGDMGFDLCYLGDLPRAVAGVQAAGGLERFLDRFWEEVDPGSDAFAALNVIAMSCAYSPDPQSSPIPARLPFDPETGAIDFEVFQSWRDFDPLHQVDDPARADALRALKLLWIDAGSRDEHGLHLGARRFCARLSALGVPHHHEEFKGGHRSLTRRYAVSLPRVVAALATSPGTSVQG